MPATLDLVSPDVLADPAPTYRRLRETQPIHWNDSVNGLALFRYKDAVELLRDPRFSADRLTPFLRQQHETARKQLEPLAAALADWMLVLDAPQHTKVRGEMNRAFTPKAVDALRPTIERLVDEMLRPIKGGTRFDLIADFAYPLPATIIAELIGVPNEERDRFKAWSDDIAAFVGNFNSTPPVVERAQASLVGMRDFFATLIEERRLRPKPDLLSALVAGMVGGKGLARSELFANVAFLLFAGHETTTNLIGNGTLALLQHPTELERLRNDRSLVGTAVEEFLRWEPPVDRITRIAKEDLEFQGHRVQAGQRVVALTAAANRDPEQFPDPESLDVTRADNRHLAFGLGAHFCIGAPLARLEGRIAFEAILRRFPDLRLEEPDVRWRDTVGFRGVESLRVRA